MTEDKFAAWASLSNEDINLKLQSLNVPSSLNVTFTALVFFTAYGRHARLWILRHLSILAEITPRFNKHGHFRVRLFQLVVIDTCACFTSSSFSIAVVVERRKLSKNLPFKIAAPLAPLKTWTDFPLNIVRFIIRERRTLHRNIPCNAPVFSCYFYPPYLPSSRLDYLELWCLFTSTPSTKCLLNDTTHTYRTYRTFRSQS